MCKSKRNGGLGIGSVLDRNKWLLAKWAWRFGVEDSPLQKRIICAKYGVPLDSLLWNWNNGATSSAFSKAVGGLFSQGSTMEKVINDDLRVIVGRGDRARLWEDVVLEGISLKEAFPRVFILAKNKTGVVRDFCAWEGNVWKWDIQFRRPFFNRELEQWECFKRFLENIRIRDSIPYTVGWTHCGKGLFSVQFFVRVLEGGKLGDVSGFKGIWQGFCPPKLEVFVWHLLQGPIMVK
ncbi:hypothetical protein Dsin_005881 [Dipteronia sinensis]|uniref:Reverse transcriptase zinc-binding domain-containing protein n=1 Tax=Dipteronia sinensis TaxID=43782 RepID=A0AAE0AYL8_9ROSI|nr:hypothetical protein Dsin_005881 [Dipteronia sinensis]